MNKDLISREALKKDLQESYFRLREIYDSLKYDEERQICEGQLITFAEAILRVKEAPAVDAVEVVHASWELKHIGHGHYWECSACHTNPCIYVTENTKFCPNCGADMRDGE